MLKYFAILLLIGLVNCQDCTIDKIGDDLEIEQGRRVQFKDDKFVNVVLRDSDKLIAQIYNNDGTKYRDEFQVNINENDIKNGLLYKLTNGNFLFFRRESKKVNESVVYDAYIQIYNDDLTRKTDVLQVVEDVSYPRIGMLENGKFVIYTGKIVQVYNNNGTTFGNSFEVKSSTLTTLKNDKIVSVYTKRVGETGDYYITDIFAEIYNLDGTIFKNDFSLNDTTIHDIYSLSVIGLTDKFIVFAGIYSADDGDFFGYYFKTYNYDGTLFNNLKGRSGSVPVVFELLNKKTVFVYRSNFGSEEDENYYIVVKLFDIDGSSVGPFRLTDEDYKDGLDSESLRSVILLSNGNLLINWISYFYRNIMNKNAIYGCQSDSELPSPSPKPVELEKYFSTEWNGICENPSTSGSYERCCDNACGICTGMGCGSKNNLLDGSTEYAHERCCGSGIRDTERICGPGVGPPCVIESGSYNKLEKYFSTTWNGSCQNIDSKNKRCCDNACGICTGMGCGSKNNLNDGFRLFAHERCCASGIESLGRVCGPGVGPPCVLPQTSRKMLFT